MNAYVKNTLSPQLGSRKALNKYQFIYLLSARSKVKYGQTTRPLAQCLLGTHLAIMHGTKHSI